MRFGIFERKPIDLQIMRGRANVCVRDTDGTLRPSQIDPLYKADLSARATGFELISPVEVPAFGMRVVEIVRLLSLLAGC